MGEYPLLKLQETWQEAQEALNTLQCQIKALVTQKSDSMNLDMLSLRRRVTNARVSLGAKLPQSILEKIALEESDFDDEEANAYRGY